MEIIDTHTHLDQVDDPERILTEAFDLGVQAVMTVGVDLQANQTNLSLQSRISSPPILVALGIHPQSLPAEQVEESLAFIRANINRAQAVGEIGLDFWYKHVRKNDEMKELQKDVFSRQLALAKEFDLPVIIHSRGAWQVCLEMVRDAGIRRGVFHWYSGPVEILDKILSLGFFVSATPSLAYSPQAREAMTHAPLEKILIETDTPVYYKNAQTQEGFAARPKDVFRTLELLAGVKKIAPDELVKIVNANARQLFKSPNASVRAS